MLKNGLQKIKGYERLVAMFHNPQTFDDAEIINMYFSRGNTLECAENDNWDLHVYPSLVVDFVIFDNLYQSNDPDANLSEIRLEFIDIRNINLLNFDDQNVIRDLNIKSLFSKQIQDNLLEVSWGGVSHTVDFICSKIELKQVKPLAKENNGKIKRDTHSKKGQ